MSDVASTANANPEIPAGAPSVRQSLTRRLTVVVRSAGERTEKAAATIVTAQLGAPPFIIRERPFSKALICSLQLAAQAGTRWSLLLDADVLLRSDALQHMVDVMEARSAVFYMCNFMVLDFGFGGPAAAGVHGYDTRLLSKALQLSKGASQTQRPETYLRQRMTAAGYPSIASRSVLGLHDYEQFYRDLYRKSFVRAFKFYRFASYMFQRLYRQQSSNEHRIMLAGLTEGLAAARPGRMASLDVDEYKERSDRALTTLGLVERHPAEGTQWRNMPDGVIDTFRPDGLYTANASWLAPEGYDLGLASAAPIEVVADVKP